MWDNRDFFCSLDKTFLFYKNGVDESERIQFNDSKIKKQINIRPYVMSNEAAS